MPTKKRATAQSSKNKRVSAATKKKHDAAKQRSRLLIIGSLVGLLILAVGAWWLFGGGKTMGIQKDMESYLEKKYGEDFVVGVPRLEGGSGLGSEPDSHRAEAHPKSKDNLTFEVGKRYWNGSFFDNYTSRVWEHEERPRVEVFLKSLKPALPYSNFQLTIGLSSAEAKDLISGSVPSIDTAIKEYGDQFNYSLRVWLSVKTLKDDQTKEDIRSQFLKAAAFIESRGIEKPALDFLINVPDENAGYYCSTSDVKGAVSVDKMLDNCLKYPNKRGVY